MNISDGIQEAKRRRSGGVCEAEAANKEGPRMKMVDGFTYLNGCIRGCTPHP
jgi:hypothetical protein